MSVKKSTVSFGTDHPILPPSAACCTVRALMSVGCAFFTLTVGSLSSMIRASRE